MYKHILYGLDKFILLNEVSKLLKINVQDFFDLTATEIIDFLDQLPEPKCDDKVLLLDIEDTKFKIMHDKQEIYLGDISLSELFYAIPHPKKRKEIAVLAILHAITSGKLSREMSQKIYE